MSEIAGAAGISKSLLFHYFHNKKELYLFLWEKCVKITMEELEKSGCYGQKDLFDMMYEGIRAKYRIMRQYPNIGAFAVKAYYEKDPEVCGDIQKSIEENAAFKVNAERLNLNPEQFIPGLDLQMMYYDMYWATEGYIGERLLRGDMDVDEIEQNFMRMIAFWKSVYLRE